jgi:hypothetical protein
MMFGETPTVVQRAGFALALDERAFSDIGRRGLRSLAQAPGKAFGQAVTLERLNNKIDEDTRL